MQRATVIIGAIIVLVLATRQGGPVRSQDAGLTPVAYLPIIEKWEPPTATPTDTAIPTSTATATSTPTATRTRTPTPIPPMLRNGDFEQGKTIWVFENSAFTVTDASRAHGGTQYAQMGSASSDDHTITQMVTVPSNAPYLEYWHANTSTQVGCYYDAGYVWIDPNPNDATFSAVIVDSVYEFCEGQEHSTYERRVVDLRSYAGQVVELQFDMSTNAGYASYWHLDDIAFRSTP